MELDKIRKHLTTRPRDLLLFELAMLTDASVQHLLGLKVESVKELKVGDALPLPNTIDTRDGQPVMTAEIHLALQQLLAAARPHAADYLFKSRKGRRPLSVPSVSRIIRGWREETGLTHLSGLRGLRSAQREHLAAAPREIAIGTQKSEKLLPKVQSQSIQEVVYQELEKAILSGKIPPGHKLVTEKIARMMAVSRIPVREAMGRLEARGLIATRPKWGSLVNALTRENLEEISELRFLLEPQAAAKAALQVRGDFLARLDQAHAAFARARKGSDSARLLQTNRHFHFLIYKQADAPMLLNIITQLWDKVSPYYHIMFRQSVMPSPSIGVNYHEHILESLKLGDGQTVGRWLKTDLGDSTQFILKLFDKYKKSGDGDVQGI